MASTNSHQSLALLSFFLLCSLLQAHSSSDFFKIPAHRTGSKESGLTVREKIQNFNTSGYLATIPNPIDHFYIFYSTDAFQQKDDIPEFPACQGREKTSVQASTHQCVFATNGGPFSYSEPTCLGNIVSNGSVITATDSSSENFGLDSEGNFILGRLTKAQVKDMRLQNLVTGFGWLLQNGTILPKKGGEIAPRTMIGLDAESKLMIFEADGVEKEYLGLTLYQAAVWFQELGAVWAINLDGGGSSTAYYKGKVIDYPTCIDIRLKCERAVTTITCII